MSDDNNNNKSKIVKFCLIIINAPISVCSIIMFVFSLAMYITMARDGDTSKTKNFLLAYTIIQLVCLILSLSSICFSLINLCFSHKCMHTHLCFSHKYVHTFSALGFIVGIVSIVTMIFGIADIVYAILIAYEFFAYNCNASYKFFAPMLIFVMDILRVIV